MKVFHANIEQHGESEYQNGEVGGESGAEEAQLQFSYEDKVEKNIEGVGSDSSADHRQNHLLRLECM